MLYIFLGWLRYLEKIDIYMSFGLVLLDKMAGKNVCRFLVLLQNC
jgi:hypothetical protein